MGTQLKVKVTPAGKRSLEKFGLEVKVGGLYIEGDGGILRVGKVDRNGITLESRWGGEWSHYSVKSFEDWKERGDRYIKLPEGKSVEEQVKIRNAQGVPIIDNDRGWQPVSEVVAKKLSGVVEQYIQTFPVLKGFDLSLEVVSVVKYDRGSGFYVSHIDASENYSILRQFSLVVYLNTVEEG